MLNQFSRTQLLLGSEAMEYLAQCRVAVFGVGGVGGYAVEALARSGIGALDLIDDDKVCLTNLNRQLHATHSTVGKYKVDAAEQRIRDINQDCRVTTYKTFFLCQFGNIWNVFVLLFANRRLLTIGASGQQQ
jgi:tRNA A37 threonylcarbamoyladenosine dehydratase